MPQDNTPKGQGDVVRRLARLRQHNPMIASAPPPAIHADAPVKHRRVAKNGSIYMSEFAAGIRVNVLRVDSETIMVSSRPENEVRAIAASIPKETVSPFSALSASLQGQRFELAADRPRGDYSGPIRVPDITVSDMPDPEDTQRTERVR